MSKYKNTINAVKKHKVWKEEDKICRVRLLLQANSVSSFPGQFAFSELIHVKQYNMLKYWRERKREEKCRLTGFWL